MNLRCAPNDIAIITRGTDRDKIVTCLKFVGTPNLHRTGRVEGDDYWFVDALLTWGNVRTGETFEAPYIRDCDLRPLRGLTSEEINEIRREVTA